VLRAIIYFSASISTEPAHENPANTQRQRMEKDLQACAAARDRASGSVRPERQGGNDSADGMAIQNI
jgi:hypothetical protein